MLVYRIEDAYGGGMYRPDGFSSYTCPLGEIMAEFPDPHMYEEALSNILGQDEYDYSYIHVSPVDDFPWEVWRYLPCTVQLEYHFAFPTITSLLSWVYMKEWREELHRRGFKVSVYEAEAIVSDSGAQAIFKKKHSKKVGEISLLEVEGSSYNLNSMGVLHASRSRSNARN